MRIYDAQLLNGSTVALNLTTMSVDIRHQEGYSFTAQVAGTAVGKLVLEASNNAFTANPNVDNPNAIWVPIPGSEFSFDATDSTKTTFLWNVVGSYYGAVRAKVSTVTGGTGTVSAWITTKGPQS